MKEQPHAAILLLLIILMIGIAIVVRGGVNYVPGPPHLANAWVCGSKLDSLNCFLAALAR
jgi:hypothetical protein